MPKFFDWLESKCESKMQNNSSCEVNIFFHVISKRGKSNRFHWQKRCLKNLDRIKLEAISFEDDKTKISEQRKATEELYWIIYLQCDALNVHCYYFRCKQIEHTPVSVRKWFSFYGCKLLLIYLSRNWFSKPLPATRTMDKDIYLPIRWQCCNSLVSRSHSLSLSFPHPTDIKIHPYATRIICCTMTLCGFLWTLFRFFSLLKLSYVVTCTCSCFTTLVVGEHVSTNQQGEFAHRFPFHCISLPCSPTLLSSTRWPLDFIRTW